MFPRQSWRPCSLGVRSLNPSEGKGSNVGTLGSKETGVQDMLQLGHARARTGSGRGKDGGAYLHPSLEMIQWTVDQQLQKADETARQDEGSQRRVRSAPVLFRRPVPRSEQQCYA